MKLPRILLAAFIIYAGALVIALTAEAAPACTATYSPIPGAALDLSPFIKS